MATLAALVGEELPDGAAPDSVNQLPAFLNKTAEITPRKPLLTTSYDGKFAIHLNNGWKAIFGTKWSGASFRRAAYYGPRPKDIPADSPELGQLYNLNEDPYETNDLWDKMPEKVSELRKLLEKQKGSDDEK